jgi:hypothetical protein
MLLRNRVLFVCPATFINISIDMGLLAISSRGMKMSLGTDLGQTWDILGTSFLGDWRLIRQNSGQEHHVDRPRLLPPGGLRVPVLLAPVENVQGARTPPLDNACPVKNVGNNRIPWLGLVRLDKFLRGNAKKSKILFALQPVFNHLNTSD